MAMRSGDRRYLPDRVYENARRKDGRGFVRRTASAVAPENGIGRGPAVSVFPSMDRNGAPDHGARETGRL